MNACDEESVMKRVTGKMEALYAKATYELHLLSLLSRVPLFLFHVSMRWIFLQNTLLGWKFIVQTVLLSLMEFENVMCLISCGLQCELHVQSTRGVAGVNEMGRNSRKDFAQRNIIVAHPSIPRVRQFCTNIEHLEETLSTCEKCSRPYKRGGGGGGN